MWSELMELEQESTTEAPGIGLVDVDYGDYFVDNNGGGTNAETTPPPVLVPIDCLYSNSSQVLLNLISPSPTPLCRALRPCAPCGAPSRSTAVSPAVPPAI